MASPYPPTYMSQQIGFELKFEFCEGVKEFWYEWIKEWTMGGGRLWPKALNENNRAGR